MIAPLGSHALKALTPRTSVEADRSRCVRHRCRQNDCRRCMDVCPSGAVHWAEQGLTVSPRLCTQCLRCLSVCPTAALKSPEFSLLRILSDLAAHPEAVLGCQRADTKAHARLSCLGCLADSELMTLLALVFKEGLQINLTGCRDCPKGQILDPILAGRDRLSEIGLPHKIRLVFEKDALACRPPSFSRRELFGLLRNRSERTAMVMVERLQGDSGMPSYGEKRIPAVRSMLLRAMEPLPAAERERISDRLFGEVSFTSTCSACGGCAGICPTGAMDPSEESGRPPVFDRNRCVGCGSCSAFCRRQGCA